MARRVAARSSSTRPLHHVYSSSGTPSGGTRSAVVRIRERLKEAQRADDDGARDRSTMRECQGKSGRGYLPMYSIVPQPTCHVGTKHSAALDIDMHVERSSQPQSRYRTEMPQREGREGKGYQAGRGSGAGNGWGGAGSGSIVPEHLNGEFSCTSTTAAGCSRSIFARATRGSRRTAS